MTPAARLADGVAALGLAALVGADAQARLLAYLALLDKWNRTHNLTAIREPERMITHHLLDSRRYCRICLRAGLRLIDIGSGGSLPGIPLAIVRPDWATL
jgi:16S rRNA (guanine527-N7)-methyltransferase